MHGAASVGFAISYKPLEWNEAKVRKLQTFLAVRECVCEEILPMARLVLAERTGVLGTALHAFLNNMPGIEEVVRLDAPQEVLPQVAQKHPDFVLLSSRLMGEELLPTITHLADTCPDVMVLVVSTDNDSRLALRALEAGARGYLLAERAVEDLQDAIDALLRKRNYLSAGIAGIPRRSKKRSDGDVTPTRSAGHAIDPHETISSRLSQKTPRKTASRQADQENNR